MKELHTSLNYYKNKQIKNIKKSLGNSENGLAKQKNLNDYILLGENT